MTLSRWRKPAVPTYPAARSLDELMADPMIRLIMAADRYSEAEVRQLCEPVQ